MDRRSGITQAAKALGQRGTLMEVVDDSRMLVEGHRGILAYGTAEIVIGASFGSIRISGSDLRLCCMSREQVFLSGNIRSVALERRPG